MLATFCLLTMVNPMAKAETIDPILINMDRVSVVKPRFKKGEETENGAPSLILMEGKQFVVRESVQQIYDKCVK